jgi:hypothetical protein
MRVTGRQLGEHRCVGGWLDVVGGQEGCCGEE